MKKILKGIMECQVGDVLAEDIIDLRSGTVLCKADYTLNEEVLRWISNFKCSPVYIKETSWGEVWNIDEQTMQEYMESKEKVKDVLISLAENKAIDEDVVEQVQNHAKEYINTNSKILGCVNLIKGVDEYTHAHSMNVGMLSVLIGRWLGLEQEALDELFLSGILHDCGKYRVAPEVLQKKGALSREEYGVVKKHVLYGYDLLKDLDCMNDRIKQGVLCHHERIDGSGYPRGLKGDEIPLYGKIIAIADVYDAMLSKRVYKEREMPFAVMEKMLAQGMGHLDTELLLVFLSHIANHYIGVFVKLSTGQEGKVVFIHPHCIHRPIIEVDGEYIDLEVRKDIEILDIE